MAAAAIALGVVGGLAWAVWPKEMDAAKLRESKILAATLERVL